MVLVVAIGTPYAKMLTLQVVAVDRVSSVEGGEV
jgi:hypothetical protein